MLKTLIQKEILNNLLNLRFSLTYFLCTFLLVGSAAIMLADLVGEKTLYDVNRNIYAQRLNAIRHPRAYLWNNKTVARPPVVTKIFAVGGEKDPDPRAEVAPEFSPYFVGDFQRNPLTNLFPSVDMVFIVGVIMSLLIFMLTYDSLSGEREEGTLKVLLSCPVPRDTVIAAKWLGGFASLIIPFITSWLVIVLIMIMIPRISIGPQEWLRILSLFAVFTLYVGVVFSLSMMVSSVSKSSNTAILLLLLVWVVGILVIPAVATPVAYLIVRPPGVQETDVAMKRIGIVEWQYEDERQKQYLKTHFGVEDEGELSPSQRTQWEKVRREWMWYELDHKIDTMTFEGRKLSRYEQRVDALARTIARFSPFGCMQNVCVSLAGTGIQRELELREAVEEYAAATLKFAREGTDHRTNRIDPAQGPTFRVAGSGVAAALGNAFLDIGVLILMGVLFAFAGYLGFVRMDIL